MCDSLLTRCQRRLIWRGPASWCWLAQSAPRPLPSPSPAPASPRQMPEGASRMMRKSVPTTLTARQIFSALTLLGTLTSLVFVLAACEDKAIGRRCDVQADAGLNQAVFNGQALECPTRICVKPSRDMGVAKAVDTAPYCTAECSKDSDCDGETRDRNNGADKRCQGGFVCGVG